MSKYKVFCSLIVEMIALNDHTEFIKILVSNHIDAIVDIIDSPNQHYEEKSGNKNYQNIFDRLGISLWNSKIEPNRILLKNEISSEEMESHLLALFGRGFTYTYEIIKDNYDFMCHLVLHEIAHIKNNWSQSQEELCDKWAFEQLEIMQNSRGT